MVADPAPARRGLVHLEDWTKNAGIDDSAITHENVLSSFLTWVGESAEGFWNGFSRSLLLCQATREHWPTLRYLSRPRIFKR